MKKDKMKVQKGWEDELHTIPHYEYISKVNIMWSADNNIFAFYRNILLLKNGKFWNCEFKKRGFVVEPKTVYWLNDEPIIILINRT